MANVGASESLSAVFARVQRLDLDGRHEEATLLLLDLTPPLADAETLHLVGHAHRAAGRYDAARALFKRSLALGSRDWHVAHDVAQEQVRLGDLLAGLAMYSRALELVGADPAGQAVSWAIRSRQVRLMLILGRRRQAHREVAALVRDSGGFEEVRARLALVLIETGAVDEVPQLLRDLELAEGADSLVCASRARLLLTRGETAAARAFVESTQAREAWSWADAPEWILALVDVSIFAGRLDRAREVLGEWLPVRNPDRRRCVRRLMLVELLDGSAGKVISLYKQQAAVDHNDALVQAMAAFAYAARAGRHDNLRAEVSMDRAVDLGLNRTLEHRLTLKLISDQIHQVYPDPQNDLRVLAPWLKMLR